jgi:aminoglycoside 6'-N-acetyltransferase I
MQKLTIILNMIIEILSKDNLKALVELVLELWTDCSYDEEIENYSKIINSEKDVCYLAKVQEKYIGFILLSVRNDYVEGATQMPLAYIEGIYVKPDYQKQGVAKKMIDIAEDWAKLKGLKQLASDTNITNFESINFHNSVGFEEVSRVVCFVKNL